VRLLSYSIKLDLPGEHPASLASKSTLRYLLATAAS
jgi:hypothetical protein